MPHIDRTRSRGTQSRPTWKIEDAKAKFSEVVRRARDEGPQYVTVRGKPTVAIIDAVEFERLLPAKRTASLLFIDVMESLFVEDLIVKRAADTGRDVNP